MLFEALEKLRKKPAHTKQTIALTTSASITVVIALFWAVSFGGYISEKSKAGMFASVALPIKEIGKLVSDGAVGIQNNTRNLFKNDLRIVTQTASSTETYETPSDIVPTDMATSTSGEELIQ